MSKAWAEVPSIITGRTKRKPRSVLFFMGETFLGSRRLDWARAPPGARVVPARPSGQDEPWDLSSRAVGPSQRAAEGAGSAPRCPARTRPVARQLLARAGSFLPDSFPLLPAP